MMICGAAGIDFDLSTKIRDVHAQILLRAAELASPHRVEDLLVRQRPPADASSVARICHSIGVR